jgi:hypothetical protein
VIAPSVNPKISNFDFVEYFFIEFPMTNIIQNSIVVAPAPHSQAVHVAL